MRLDRTFIAIRERSTLEIFDLALQVVRQHFWNLMLLLLIGALPWIIVDWVLLGWILWSNLLVPENRTWFYWLMSLLVISQAQLGTTMLTYYLGQSMFIEQPTVGKTVRDTRWKPLIFWWVHWIWRMVLFLLVVVGVGFMYGENSLVAISFFGAIIAAFGWLVRANRPFVTEILLLEKTPVRETAKGHVSFAKRSVGLHQGAWDIVFASITFYPLLFLAMYAALNLVDDSLALQSSLEFPLKSVYWTIALWLTAGFAAVLRFLQYIDLRIRQEGWAVELKMRAEGIRLRGSEAV